MKHPTFLEGVSIALATGLAGSILFTVMTPPLLGVEVLRLLISLTGLGYSIYLLGRSTGRTGRVTAIASWILLAGICWFLNIPLSLYLVLHLGAIWIIRSLYFYSSLLSALADLGLIGLGASSAIWAFIHTGSLFLAIWCFFLAQALFVFIPKRMPGRSSRPVKNTEDQFERAHSNAQAALHRLSTRISPQSDAG